MAKIQTRMADWIGGPAPALRERRHKADPAQKPPPFTVSRWFVM